jgi:HlyB family type I secretion system ABC transporter
MSVAVKGGARAVLQGLPLLRFMPEDVATLVKQSFEPCSFPFGAEITREGDPADAFYVLASGTARAVKAGRHGEEVPLNLIKPGDSFGEVALLEGTTRTATVRARSEVEALRLDRGVFLALLRSNPQIDEYLRLHVRQYHLRYFFRLYSPFAGLPRPALAHMLAELEPMQVARGEKVVRQGDRPGPMYVVLDGRLRAHREGSDDVAYLRTGDFFGERSLLNDEPRAVTVEALIDCALLKLKPDTFQQLCAEHAEFREQIERRVSQYEYKQAARVPLDFADEALPAGVGGYEQVLDQVDEVIEEAQTWQSTAEVHETLPDDGLEGAQKRIRRFPHVWQVDEMDCGAASLAMVCRHFGRKVSLAHIRRVVHTSTDGTSLMGIARGAEGLGLTARTVKASTSKLHELPLPAIVHWEGNHWVVLYDVADGHVRVSDPARGLRRLKRDEFTQRWSGYAALLARAPEFDNAPEAEPSFRWLLAFFRPYRGTFARALLLAVVAAGLEMLIPVFSQVIVDTAVLNRDYGLLTVLVLGMLGVLVGAIAATVVQRYLLSRSAVEIDHSTFDFLTWKLLDLPLSYFASRRTGDIERRLAGLQQLRLFLVQNGVQGLTAATQVALAVVVMFVYSRTLALVYLAATPLYVGLMRFSRKRLRPTFDSLEEAYGKYHSRQIDAIKGIETVKAMAAEPALRRVMRGQFNELATRVFSSDLTMMLYDGAIQMVTFLSLALFLWVGALQVLAEKLSIGQLVAFNTLVVLANAPIGVVLLLWDQLQYSNVLLNRLNDILDQEPEQGADHSHLTPVPTLEGRVSLHRVGFHYSGPVEVPILTDLTLEVEPGTTIAIVGRSGSGKTTLVKCLAGLLEPTAGTILYDGVDLRTLEYRDLRRRIGFVLQESYLFDETIARNIAFGEDEVDMKRVIWAARVANAAEFVESLPLGYDTRVGETGLLLSVGQKQRIAIARAVYSRPPVLILDEATSSLDSESERAVQENMDRLLEGRTSFVIAHRLSTVRDADLIVVLDKGKLVEQGTHDELMDRKGLYYYLVSQQLEM